MGRRSSHPKEVQDLKDPEESLNDHVHRVSTALALINMDEENPLSPERWNAREAYLIQVCAAMPWIRDGEAAKLVGRSIPWVRNLRQHPDFKQSVQKMISIITRAMGVQMEVLQHKSFEILRDRLDNTDEDKQYEAAMAVLKGTGVLSPKSEISVEVEHKFAGLETDAVRKIREWMWEKERKELEAQSSAQPVVIEGTAREVETARS